MVDETLCYARWLTVSERTFAEDDGHLVRFRTMANKWLTDEWEGDSSFGEKLGDFFDIAGSDFAEVGSNNIRVADIVDNTVALVAVKKALYVGDVVENYDCGVLG